MCDIVLLVASVTFLIFSRLYIIIFMYDVDIGITVTGQEWSLIKSLMPSAGQKSGKFILL